MESTRLSDGVEKCVACGKDIPEGRQVCIICGYKADKVKQTNYDRIRNMSVDELAEVLYRANDEICFENCNKDTGNKYSCSFGDELKPENCLTCMKRWLESEVTE